MTMRTHHIAFLVAALASCPLWAGDAPAEKEELPAAAKKAMSSAEDAIAKARATFRTAAAKEQDKLLTALQREQEAQTKAGKLEAALAVKALAEKVRSGDYLRELEEQAGAGQDLLGEGGAPAQAVPPSRIAGHWRLVFNNDWRRLVRIEPDGRCTVIESNNVQPGSNYTIRWDAKTQRFVTDALGDSMLETYRVEGDRILCDHWCDRSKYPAEGPSLTAQFERPQPPGQGQGQGPARPVRQGR